MLLILIMDYQFINTRGKKSELELKVSTNQTDVNLTPRDKEHKSDGTLDFSFDQHARYRLKAQIIRQKTSVCRPLASKIFLFVDLTMGPGSGMVIPRSKEG
jgi:hypothetical protein